MNQSAAIAIPVTTAQPVRSSLVGEGTVVLLVVLVLPLAMYAQNLAPYARWLYPGINLLLAGYLFARRSPWYVGHCLLIFCCVSLVRRLVDEQTGWDPSSPVLLTPYLCCGYTVFSFFEYWSRPQPRRIGPFLLLLACVAYGTAVAVVNGRMHAALVDAMKWSIGPLIAVYLLSQNNQSEIRHVLEGTLVWAGAVMGVYGLLQYIDPPSWDAFWMRNVTSLGATSFGQPEPFSVRVFSTLNSPGSLGAFLSAGMVIALKRRTATCVVVFSLMAGGLALTQYRAIWTATALALLLLIASPGRPLRMTNVVALVIALLAVSSTAMLPPIREAVIQRAATIQSLKGDASLEERARQYAAFTSQPALFTGQGLAINGATRRLDNVSFAVIDSGLLEIWQGLGLIVGSIFLASFIRLTASLFLNPGSVTPHLPFDRAVVTAMVVQLPMGSVHVGELGLCAWMFLGLALMNQDDLR